MLRGEIRVLKCDECQSPSKRVSVARFGFSHGSFTAMHDPGANPIESYDVPRYHCTPLDVVAK